MSISEQFIRSILHYNPETGEFTRVRSNRRKTGSLNNRGYVRIGIKDKSYLAHRLAWFFMTGYFPNGELDHIDGDKTNNRFSNLRIATRSENERNKPARRDSKSGHRGISFKQGRWVAKIFLDGKQIEIGRFKDIEHAKRAYSQIALRRFGAFVHDAQSMASIGIAAE